MKRTNDNFIQYLLDKFGKTVTPTLLKNSISENNNAPLVLKDESADPLFKKNTQIENTSIVTKLINPKFSIPEDKDLKNWAFDFPGWVDTLNIEGNAPAKKIMLIGLEPHIQDTDYQVCYGLRRAWQKNKEKQGLVLDTSFDNCTFETNLKELFPDPDKNAFYEQFYITDLCFFAPKGNANLIQKIKDWNSIRSDIAGKFLSKEIEFIAPQIIVASGGKAAFSTEQFLNTPNKFKLIKRFSPSHFETKGKLVNYPYLALYEQLNTHVHFIFLKVPHLASGRTKGYWTREFRAEIQDKINDLKKQIPPQL